MTKLYPPIEITFSKWDLRALVYSIEFARDNGELDKHVADRMIYHIAIAQQREK